MCLLVSLFRFVNICKHNNFASKDTTFRIVIVGMMIINKYSLWSMMTLSRSKSCLRHKRHNGVEIGDRRV